jgi:hypothetical protein
MTRERARAYGRVLNTLKELGPAKLQPAEQATIRHAADSLLFTADLRFDAAAQTAAMDFRALYDQLLTSGRWTADRAGRLADDLWACGPGMANVMPIAA